MKLKKRSHHAKPHVETVPEEKPGKFRAALERVRRYLRARVKPAGE